MSVRAYRALGIAGILLGLRLSSAGAPAFEIVHAFRSGGDPRSILLRASDGVFYGTTVADGTARLGSIFRIDATGNFTTLHSFRGPDGAFPTGALIQASDGSLYGTTYGGGVFDDGIVFRMDDVGNVTTLHSFSFGTEGAFPQSGLVEAADGNFYGTTISGGSGASGTVFRITAGGDLVTLHAFSGGDGLAPIAPLIQGTDGLLYGTTSFGGTYDGGTVFRLDPSGSFTSLYSFTGNNEPSNPQSPLVQAADGYFYGTGGSGGPSGHGSVFRMDSAGNITTLHFFSVFDSGPQSPLTIASDGFLYGTTQASLYRMDLAGNTTTLHSFTFDEGQNLRGVVEANGLLFGIASDYGPGGRGAVFRADGSGTPTTIHAFDSGDGARPATGVLQGSDGFLYGTTLFGGAASRGNVFKMTLSGGIATLHSFDSSDGNPQASLVEGGDGAFYGMSGTFDAVGNVYRVTSTGVESTLHTFPPDGTSSVAPLVLGSDGFFYGTTQNGGPAFLGTAFRVDSAGGFTPLHGFTFSEGAAPNGLIQASDGFFYGTAQSGGLDNLGTVFRMSAAGDVTVLHDFALLEGAAPMAGLIHAADGFFYGTTYAGGAHGRGTVFRMDAAGTFSLVHDFDVAEGASSTAPLLEASDGWLYGTTYYGASDPGLGTVFRVDPATGNFETVHAFGGFDGSNPLGGLIQASDGNLYGTASQLGPGQGLVFRLILASFAATRVDPSSGPAAGGTPAGVFGAGFTSASLVSIGGQPAPSGFVDATHLETMTPALTPGTLADVTVTAGAMTATLTRGFFADFRDVLPVDAVHADVERLVRYGITAGCGGGGFCPGASVTRAQIAVFLLRARHGAGYVPTACVGLFGDVPCPGRFADWIEALSTEGITGGCGEGNFCPASPVTRAQLSAFLLKSEHGSTFSPPACQGAFDDVFCPSLFADWIEQLLAEGITAGCRTGPPLYCPSDSVTRRQSATLLVNTFKLP